MDHRVAYVVIGAYLLLMVSVGLLMRRLNRDENDYFRSGCKGTWWLVGGSAFMGAFSAWTFSGGAGSAFEAGWSITIIYFANALGFLLNAVWLAPWFRQMRAITVPQVIEERFGTVTQQFYAWINIVLGLLYSALWLFGLAIFVSAVFGYPITGVVIVVGLVVLVYSVTGGSWAVMSSDFLQALVLVPVTVLLAFLSLRAVGGVGGFVEQVQADADVSKDFALVNDATRFAGQYTWLWAVAIVFKNVIGYNTMNSAVRYFSVKDGREAQKAAWLGLVLMVGGAVLWIIPPMVGRLLFASEIGEVAIPKPAESAYAIVSLKLLPGPLVGLMVVSMLAATMSSMDTGLNRNAAIFTQDVYPLLMRLLKRKPVSGAALMRCGQLFSLVFGVMIILIALRLTGQEGKGVFEHMLTLGAVLALPLAVPLLLAMFVKRSPNYAALVSVAAAAVPSAWGLVMDWPFEWKVLSNLSVGVVAYLATTAFWRFEPPAYRAKVDRFFDQMHRPVNFKEEVGEGNDQHQLRIMGWLALGSGLFIALLVLLPGQTMFDRGCELFVSGFVLCVALLLLIGSRRREVLAEGEVRDVAR